MTIDRLLIICSLVELCFVACSDGPDCFTYFQWAAIVLLCIKGMLALAAYRHAVLSATPNQADSAGTDFAADSDIPA